MGRLLQLAQQASASVDTAKRAIEELENAMASVEEEVSRLDGMKTAFDSLSTKLSKASSDLGETLQKVEAAKDLRKQLTALLHNPE